MLRSVVREHEFHFISLTWPLWKYWIRPCLETISKFLHFSSVMEEVVKYSRLGRINCPKRLASTDNDITHRKSVPMLTPDPILVDWLTGQFQRQ